MFTVRGCGTGVPQGKDLLLRMLKMMVYRSFQFGIPSSKKSQKALSGGMSIYIYIFHIQPFVREAQPQVRHPQILQQQQPDVGSKSFTAVDPCPHGFEAI